MTYSRTIVSYFTGGIFAAALFSGLTGCAMFGGKSGVAAPVGDNPHLVFAGAWLKDPAREIILKP